MHQLHSSISSEDIHSAIRSGEFTPYEQEVPQISVTILSVCFSRGISLGEISRVSHGIELLSNYFRDYSRRPIARESSRRRGFSETRCSLYSPRSQSLSFRSLSFSAMTYQTQANQCATSMKNSMSIVRMTALYCEYLSIFCRRRASLSSRVSFTRWMLLCADSCEAERTLVIFIAFSAICIGRIRNARAIEARTELRYKLPNRISTDAFRRPREKPISFIHWKLINV